MYIVQRRFLGPDGPTVLSTLSGCFDACLMASFPLLHTHGGVVRPNIPNLWRNRIDQLVGARLLEVSIA